MREGSFLWLLPLLLRAFSAATALAEESSSSGPAAEELPLNAQRTGTLPAGALAQARYVVRVPTATPLLNVRLYRRTAFATNLSRQLLCLGDGPTPPDCVPVLSDTDEDYTDDDNTGVVISAPGTRIRVDTSVSESSSSSSSDSDSGSSSSNSDSSSSGEEPKPRTLVETLYNVYVENVPANATYWVVVAGTGGGYDYDVRACAGGCAAMCLLDCFGHGACSAILHLCQCDPGYSGLACSHGRADTSSEPAGLRWWSRYVDAVIYSALAVVLAIVLIVAALFTYQWCRYGRCCACCCAGPCCRRARRRSMYAKFDPAAHAPGVVHYRSVSTRNLMVYRAAPQVAVPHRGGSGYYDGSSSSSSYDGSSRSRSCTHLVCDATSPSVNSWGSGSGGSGGSGGCTGVVVTPDTAPLSPSDMSLSPASSFTRVYLKKR